MSKRIKTSFLALAIAFAAFALSGRPLGQVATAAPVASYDLLSILPASDFIVYVDAQRIMTDIVPAILVDHPEARARLEADIEKVKKHAGLDPRLIDSIAFGLNFNSQGATRPTYALIVRGRFDSNAAIETGLNLAVKESKGELVRRTKVYEGRTVQMLVPHRRPFVKQGEKNESEDKPSDQAMVFVALDSNTVAFGNLKSVHATIDANLGRGRVDVELVQLATRTPNAALAFSGKIPPDMSRLIRVGNKEAENSLASMKLVYGAFNTSGNDAEGVLNIRTEADEDARKLSLALNALKFIAKIGSTQQSNEKVSIQAMINNVEVYAVGNEVQIISKVPLKDLASFIPRR